MVLLAALVSCAVLAAAAPQRLLQGSYPDFRAPPYRAPASHCDVTAAPWSAAGDGVTDDTAALKKCIEQCPRDPAGSFAVVLKEGRVFLTGSLNLTSGCHLVVDGRLLGSTDPARYPIIPPLPGYGPGQRDDALHGWGRHQALLSGWNVTDVVVRGSGVIDGQGLVADPALGTSWVGRLRNLEACEAEGSCSRQPAGTLLSFGRPRVWEPMFSSRLSLLNVSITNQAFWCVHPYGCNDVLISNVNISAPRDEGIPNDDGIDPDSTSNVLVEGCWVSVGDNSVAIKSGMNWLGRRLGMASYNQVYRDSVFVAETFAIGSEMSGGVFNITVDGCLFGGDHSDFAGVHFKAPRPRGGSVHDIRILNSEFRLETSARQPMPFSASMFYGSTAPPGNRSSTPAVYDCLFANLSVHLPPSSSRQPSFRFLGIPESPMRGFHFADITVHSGHSRGWQCANTSGFSFERISPAPTAGSGCLL